MSFDNFMKIKSGIIVDVDNYTNVHLSDPIFIEYLVRFSEKGGASAFLSKNINNLNILKKNTSLPIFAEVEENFNDIFIRKTYDDFKPIIELGPNFIVIEVGNFEKHYDELKSLLHKIKFNFSGQVVGKVLTKSQAIQAYKLGFDALVIEIFGECVDKEFVSEICSDINIPTIASLNSVSFEDSKDLIELGIHSFILGEDVTNPSKIIKQLTIKRFLKTILLNLKVCV